MSYEQLEFASSFASEQCPEGAWRWAGAEDTLQARALLVLGRGEVLWRSLATRCAGSPDRVLFLSSAELIWRMEIEGILACERLGELFNQTAVSSVGLKCMASSVFTCSRS